MIVLDLADPVALTAALVDVPSVSGEEGPLADAVEDALRGLAHLQVERAGDTVTARTSLGRGRRILLAGHLDTVPSAGNVPSRTVDGRIHGCGSSDMKSGLAVLLHVAATVTDPTSDLTFVCYDNEEVEASRNGLGRLATAHPDRLAADLAILMEPTSAQVEAGCQGTLRVRLEAHGRRAHSARSWLGDDAIHRLALPLTTLAGYVPRTVDIDGCTYREGLSAVDVSGGVAGNIIPDHASLTVNFRFAPDRSEDEAYQHVRAALSGEGLTLTRVDSAPGALPRLDRAAAAAFMTAVGGLPAAKLGWTDVARFAALGIAAVNYGPGDPNLAHTREEYVEIEQIERCASVLISYLTR